MPSKGYRYSLDPFLLAHFIRIPPRAQWGIDLGTGSGIILFLLRKKEKKLRYVGLERQGKLLVEAGVKKKEDKAVGISFVQGDIRSCSHLFPEHSFDLVFSNPPYYKKGTGRINPDPEKAAARHEIHITLKEMTEQASHLLKDSGSFSVIHHPARLQELLSEMETQKIRPLRIRYVRSSIKGETKMVLVEGIKNGKASMHVEAPLVVRDDSGDYSEEMKEVYGMKTAESRRR